MIVVDTRKPFSNLEYPLAITREPVNIGDSLKSDPETQIPETEILKFLRHLSFASQTKISAKHKTKSAPLDKKWNV